MSIGQIKFFVYILVKKAFIVVLNRNIINIEKKIVVYYVEKSTDYYLPPTKIISLKQQNQSTSNLAKIRIEVLLFPSKIRIKVLLFPSKMAFITEFFLFHFDF